MFTIFLAEADDSVAEPFTTNYEGFPFLQLPITFFHIPSSPH